MKTTILSFSLCVCNSGWYLLHYLRLFLNDCTVLDSTVLDLTVLDSTVLDLTVLDSTVQLIVDCCHIYLIIDITYYSPLCVRYLLSNIH